MGINITGLTITNNEIIIDYKGGVEPKKSMICNGIDLEGGYASFTNYSSLGLSGTWGANKHVDALTGWYSAAVPYYWYTKDSSTNGKAHGNCDKGISGWTGAIPNYKDEYLCYKITNQADKSNSANIIVIETCGGSCGSSHPNNECPTCCFTDMYKSETRSFPTQLCDPMYDTSVNWKKLPSPSGIPPPTGSIYSGEYSDKTKCSSYVTKSYILDWCGGHYAHFDLDDRIKTTFAQGNNGILKYERINCPNELPPIPKKVMCNGKLCDHNFVCASWRTPPDGCQCITNTSSRFKMCT
jgi:hypothetical protein